MVWDSATGKKILTLDGHSDGEPSVAWSADGLRMAAVSLKTGEVWDAVTGKELLTLGNGSLLSKVAWSPERQVFGDQWSDHPGMGRGDRARNCSTLDGHDAWVNSVAWSPVGRRRLATGNWDGTAKVWDTETGKKLLTLSGHHGFVNSVAWSPDGHRLATGNNEDGMAIVWDAETGKELLTLSGHHGPVYSVAWSPDGLRLATGNNDGIAMVWDSVTGKELLTLSGPHGPGMERVLEPGAVSRGLRSFSDRSVFVPGFRSTALHCSEQVVFHARCLVRSPHGDRPTHQPGSTR